MILSTLGVGLGFLATGAAPTLPALFAARAWLGVCAGTGSTSRAYIADITSPEERTDAMGRAGALMMVGYAAGAPLGSEIAALCGGFRAPFFAGASCRDSAEMLQPGGITVDEPPVARRRGFLCGDGVHGAPSPPAGVARSPNHLGGRRE